MLFIASCCRRNCNNYYSLDYYAAFNIFYADYNFPESRVAV
jgi:hypothetical protein